MSLVEKIFTDPFQEFLAILVILLGCAVIVIKLVPRIPLLKKVTYIPFLFLVPMILSNAGVIPVKYPLYKPLQSITLYMAMVLLYMLLLVYQVYMLIVSMVLHFHCTTA